MSDTEKDYLYHYTTLGGLKGILETQTLWATHFEFLNDSSELKVFKEKFLDILKEDSWIRDNFESLIESLQSVTGKQDIYISSFCSEPKDPYTKKNGLLSQWRGYGHSSAAAIAFDKKTLYDKIQAKGEDPQRQYTFLKLKKVIYPSKNTDLIKRLNKEIEDLKKLGREFIEANNEQDQEKCRQIGGQLYKPYLEAITSCKHPSFHEENEVRIIAHPIFYDSKLRKEAKVDNVYLDPEREKEIHFRSNGHSQIPYIKLFEDAEDSLPIEKVILGPQKDQEKQKRSLKIFLENLGLGHIKVTCSETPYTGI